MAWVVLSSPQKEAHNRLTAGLWVLFGGLLGARTVFVVQNWPYFQAYPGESVLFFLGGLAWPGALAGGLLALGIYAWINHFPVRSLADALLPLVACLAVSAWLGCWLEGCAYGAATNAWWGLPGRDEWGAASKRVPIQLMGALLTLLVIEVLDWGQKRLHRSGLAAALALLGLSLELFGLSFLRADPAPLWNGVRLDAWAALIFAGIAGVAIIITALLRNEAREMG